MNNTHKTISDHLNALNIDVTNYEALVRCYILAQLNIQYSSGLEYKDGVNAGGFGRICVKYRLLPTAPESNYLHNPAFPLFCKELAQNGMANDYRLFFESFAPFLVANWNQYESLFPAQHRHKILVILYLILKSTNESNLQFPEISRATIEALYDTNIALYNSLQITKDTFVSCWRAVYCFPMPDLKGTVSSNLAKTIRFYRQHKVSGLQLVAHFCQYNKHRSQLEDAFNPWIEFEQTINQNKNIAEGISIAESAFNMVAEIKNEKPSDIIRAALYPFPALFGRRADLKVRNNYDGKFECSFLLQQFEKLAQNAFHILIVNPGPDFLLTWAHKSKGMACKCCVAVSNKYVAAAYRMEFKNFEFCTFSDIAYYKNRFGLVAIVSPCTTEKLDINMALAAGGANANFIALLPQTMISRATDSVGAILHKHGFSFTKIIAISSHATVSEPRKKMLVYANNSTGCNAHFPIFFTQCDAASNMIVQKEYIKIFQNQLDRPTTLLKLHHAFEKAKVDQSHIKRRNRANTYLFSDEITLCYTTHRDKHNVWVGQAYYKGITAPENTINGQRWDSPITQKGLRCEEEFAKSKVESVPYYDAICPYIVGDMLDFYGDSLDQCSLKTIWFCCRSRLMTHPRYRDEIARDILFGPNQNELSSIHPSNANDEDYRKAMQAVIPNDSFTVVKFWQQLNIIMRAAVDSGFIPSNPISALLPEISKRASKELQNLRNMLTKKTFTFDEEARIMAYVRAESDIAFGPRKAFQYEVDGTLLLGPMHLFTGMSTREACALTWKDFEPIPGLDAYHLLVYKFLLDDGNVTYQMDDTTNRYTYRKIPVAPLLADMLNSRKTYLKVALGFTEAELQHLPIIMDSNKKASAIRATSSFCKYDVAIRVCRTLIEKANIPTQELILPGNGEEVVVDMNKYQGDIFYTNFKHRANHTCSFDRGELSYVIGNKAPDTFSQHYCDYANDLVQYAMIQKLNRWTHMYATSAGNVLPVTSEASTFTRNKIVNSTPQKDQYNAVSITLSSLTQELGGYIDISVECQHGVSGSITVYDARRKEEG